MRKLLSEIRKLQASVFVSAEFDSKYTLDRTVKGETLEPGQLDTEGSDLEMALGLDPMRVWTLVERGSGFRVVQGLHKDGLVLYVTKERARTKNEEYAPY